MKCQKACAEEKETFVVVHDERAPEDTAISSNSSNACVGHCNTPFGARSVPSLGGIDVRWFRTHRLTGSALALFALALQFVVSFGHIHADDFTKPHWATAGIKALAPAADPDHQDNDGRADVCDICATMALLAHAKPAEPPALPPPPFVREVGHVAHRAAVERPTDSPFRSRAPPAT